MNWGTELGAWVTVPGGEASLCSRRRGPKPEAEYRAVYACEEMPVKGVGSNPPHRGVLTSQNGKPQDSQGTKYSTKLGLASKDRQKCPQTKHSGPLKS